MTVTIWILCLVMQGNWRWSCRSAIANGNTESVRRAVAPWARSGWSWCRPRSCVPRVKRRRTLDSSPNARLESRTLRD